MRVLVSATLVGLLLLLTGCSALQRQVLFFPSHHDDARGLTPWTSGETVIGFARIVPTPNTVWLMCHGNAGQAADRVYALGCFPEGDAVYILEYPGYGRRPGTPSTDTLNRAAAEAYALLRRSHPSTPIAVVGESIGSGPACSLATASVAPDKIALVVPFKTLADVAADHFPWLPVRLILGRSWDNAQALRSYRGPVDIFGAHDDEIIAVQHAKALAESTPTARFYEIEGRHNDWSTPGRVSFRR